MKKQDNKWPIRFLRWFCREDYLEELEGDLLEVYERDKVNSPFLASFQMLISILKYFRPEFIKKISMGKMNQISMIRYNFILSFRNFKKEKLTFTINLLGLTTGLVSLLFITLWVDDELQKANVYEPYKIVQVMQNEPSPNGIITTGYTAGPLAEELASTIPEVEFATSIITNEMFEGEKFVVSAGESEKLTVEIQFATPDYFEVFPLSLSSRSADNLLANPKNVVISSALAQKLFKTSDAEGKSLTFHHSDFGGTYNISGVFTNDTPTHFDALFAMKSFNTAYDAFMDWGNFGPQTHVRLANGATINAFNDKVVDIMSKKSVENITLFGQTYRDRYLYNRYENGNPAGGRIDYIQLFTALAICILLLASINFISLATARMSARLREVGVKKVNGATQMNLFAQFLTEAFIIVSISALIAIIAVFAFLPQFNTLFSTSIPLYLSSSTILTLLAVIVITGLISGLYPAWIMSKLAVVTALRGKIRSFWKGKLLHSGLVVLQFSCSFVLIVLSIIIYKQIEYTQNKDLGYIKDNVIMFTMDLAMDEEVPGKDNNGYYEGRIATFIDHIRQLPGVENASNFWQGVLGGHGTTTGLTWSSDESEENTLFAQVSGGYEFVETIGFEIIEGRSFSRERSTDNQGVILNETAINLIGWEDPVDKEINLWGEDRKIIGVIKDFHIDSFHQKILPTFITLTPGKIAPNVLVRINQSHREETLAGIETAYESFFPSGLAFDYRFLDQSYEQMYADEKRTAQVAKYSAFVAVIISCLGLFGFATFSAQSRTKEIGIRKTLGSSVAGIFGLISLSFSRIVVFSILLGLPMSIYLGNQWLQGFNYRTEMDWRVFVFASLIALVISFATVGGITLRACRLNPIDCLRKD